MKSLAISISAVLIAALLLVGGRVYLGQKEGVAARDIKRLADVRRVQYGFERLFLAENSYLPAVSRNGCTTGADVRTCNIGEYVKELPTLVDPNNGFYVINEDPTETTFSFLFELEGSYAGLSKGVHAVTQDGIN